MRTEAEMMIVDSDKDNGDDYQGLKITVIRPSEAR
jgi:hypothetical protein